MNEFKCEKCDGDIELSYGLRGKFIFEKCLKCDNKRGFHLSMYLTEDEQDLIQALLKEKIEKTRKKKLGREFLEAGAGKAYNMLNSGLIEHLEAQSAEGLLKKMEKYK